MHPFPHGRFVREQTVGFVSQGKENLVRLGLVIEEGKNRRERAKRKGIVRDTIKERNLERKR